MDRFAARHSVCPIDECDVVTAAPAGDEVVCRSSLLVRGIARSEDPVVSRTAVQRVLAGPSAEDVVPRVAGEAVRTRAAAQLVRSRPADEPVIDSRVRVLLEAAADQEVGAACRLPARR